MKSFKVINISWKNGVWLKKNYNKNLVERNKKNETRKFSQSQWSFLKNIT